jgi:hypothetical protein
MMIPLENGDIDLVALRDIAGCKGGELGAEITIDYRKALALSGIQKPAHLAGFFSGLRHNGLTLIGDRHVDTPPR